MSGVRVSGDDYCFACGPRNPIGLRLVFEIDAARRSSRAVFIPRAEHQGYIGITHGGILTTILDEAMIKLCWSLGIPAVTARLEVRFKKPAPVGKALEVNGRIAADRGRTLLTTAQIVGDDGSVVAEATATAVVQGRRQDASAEPR